MSQPRFLADEDLRCSIVLATRRLEPGVYFSTVRDVGLGGASDAQVLEFAAREGLAIVSHDVNTMRNAAEKRVHENRPMAGLFLTPQHRSNREIAEAIALIWSASEAEEWPGRTIFLPL